MQLSEMHGTGRVKEILMSLDVTLTDNFFVMRSSVLLSLSKSILVKYFKEILIPLYLIFSNC